MKNNPNMLSAALFYSQVKGWYIFPTRECSGGFYTDKRGRKKELAAKSPYVKGGFKVATRDENIIRKWWERWPNAGIGISCGASNLVVIDVDVKDERGGIENFHSMNLDNPKALHASTPSGGLHVVFSGLVCSSANVKNGVDIRSQGAYFIAPPSFILNPDGTMLGKYKVTDDWRRTPPPAPDDLIEKYNILRYGKKEVTKRNPEEFKNQSEEQLFQRAKIAVSRLDKRYATDYFSWIKVGLILKRFGDRGKDLWIEWSKTCPEKFDMDACLERWDNFEPKDVTIGTLFHMAWKKGVAREEF